MSDTKNKSAKDSWNSSQAYTLAVVCLLIGLAGGYFLRGSQAPSSAAAAAESSPGPSATGAQPTPEQMKHMADTKAAPLLDTLKSDPNNPALLASIANIYYDTQQFSTAIDYYQRSLAAQPTNADVRTDLATAYWYMGNADGAIAEFDRALGYEPNKANTLFNLGIVKWKGKMDIKGAVDAWQKLLTAHPDYESKDRVLQLIAEAQKHSGVKPGTPAKPLSN